MANHVILTPYFIDQSEPFLNGYWQEGWELNTVSLPEGDAQARASAVHTALADKVVKALKAGKRPVSIAGDCCATLGVLAGLQRAGMRPTLLWLDSHGDFNTWQTTPSGFLGGMPLAMIAGLGELRMNRAVGLEPLPANQIVLADGRDLDPGEKTLVERSGINHLQAFSSLKDYPFEGPVYLHFDCDVLHLDDVSAVKYPAAGGPRAAEVAEVFGHLKRLELVAISATIGSWDASKGDVAQSDRVARELLELLYT
jgi:arginase